MKATWGLIHEGVGGGRRHARQRPVHQSGGGNAIKHSTKELEKN